MQLTSTPLPSRLDIIRHIQVLDHLGTYTELFQTVNMLRPEKAAKLMNFFRSMSQGVLLKLSREIYAVYYYEGENPEYAAYLMLMVFIKFNLVEQTQKNSPDDILKHPIIKAACNVLWDEGCHISKKKTQCLEESVISEGKFELMTSRTKLLEPMQEIQDLFALCAKAKPSNEREQAYKSLIAVKNSCRTIKRVRRIVDPIVRKWTPKVSKMAKIVARNRLPFEDVVYMKAHQISLRLFRNSRLFVKLAQEAAVEVWRTVLTEKDGGIAREDSNEKELAWKACQKHLKDQLIEYIVDGLLKVKPIKKIK